MKKILTILFILFTTFSFAQVKVNSDGNIIPTGNYPAVNSKDIKGTLHTFKTIAQRDALPSNYRDTGMIAYVIDSTKYYSLSGGIDNSNWRQVFVGDGTINLTPNSIPYVGSDGALTENNTGLYWDGNNIVVGANGYYNTTGILLNGGRASIQANGAGINIKTVGTSPGDASKHITFYNSDKKYLDMYMDADQSMNLKSSSNIFPDSANKRNLGKLSSQWDTTFTKTLYLNGVLFNPVAGSGISHVVSGFGLANTNDSTVYLDSVALKTIVYNKQSVDSGLATKSNVGHVHDASDITSGIVNPARLGTGIADATKVLLGNSTWGILPATNLDSVAYRTVPFPDSTGYWELNDNGDTILTHYFVGSGGGGGGSYKLPYNGNATDYLGGDTVYHALPSTPNLSQVLAAGSAIIGSPSYGIQFYNSDYTKSLLLNFSGTYNIVINSDASNYTTYTGNQISFNGIKSILPGSITTSKNISFPNPSLTNSYLASSVNGTNADGTGNITFGTISGSLSICGTGIDSLKFNGTQGGLWQSMDTSKVFVDPVLGVAHIKVTSTIPTIITYSVLQNGGYYTAMIPIKSDVTPDAGSVSDTSSSTVTVGNYIILTRIGGMSGGTWKSSNVAKATVVPIDEFNVKVYGVSTGNATITYNMTNSCGSSSAGEVVFINP